MKKLDELKKAASALLLLVLFWKTGQNANAQELDFSNIISNEEIDSLNKENAEKRRYIAEMRKKLATTKAERDKQD